MRRTRPEHPRLQIESLETRTLLAGDMGAISGTGDYITNYDPDAMDSVLSIASRDGGTLVIDSVLLSDAVKTLRIAGFSDVRITGTDTFREVYLWDVNTFSGQNIDVTGTLKTSNVDNLKLNSIAGVAWLYGDRMRLEVVDARSVTIMSALESLTLSTKNKVSLLGSPELGQQEVRLEFRLDGADIPASMKVSMLDDPSSAPGDPLTPSDPEAKPPTYVVIVIISNPSSEGANALLGRLQEALSGGDATAIKAAFAEYVKSLQTSQTPAGADMAFAAAAAASSNPFAESLLSGVSAEDSSGKTSDRSVGSMTVTRFSIPDSAQVESTRLASSLGADSGSLAASLASDTDGHAPAAFTAMVAPDSDPSFSDGASHTNPHQVIDGIRSTLAGLVSDLNSSVNTVSAYIVERVGNDLEPGELPGLLVEARSSRARRDSVEWIEV